MENGAQAARGASPSLFSVAFAADEAYLPHFSTAAISLLNSNAHCLHQIFLISPEPPSRKFRKFREFVRREFEIEVVHIHIDPGNFGGMTAPGHLSISAYSRLFLAELLPPDLDQVLYLDCDVLVYSSMEDLFRESANYFESDSAHTVRAVPSPRAKGEHLEFAGHKGEGYFNSGVLVVNLRGWRTSLAAKHTAEIARRFNGRLPLADQDALNLFFEDRWDSIDRKYNDRLKSAESNAVVVHFVGAIKPWHWGNKHPNRRDYDFFRSKTPFWPYLRVPSWSRIRGRLTKNLRKKLRIFIRGLRALRN